MGLRKHSLVQMQMAILKDSVRTPSSNRSPSCVLRLRVPLRMVTGETLSEGIVPLLPVSFIYPGLGSAQAAADLGLMLFRGLPTAQSLGWAWCMGARMLVPPYPRPPVQKALGRAAWRLSHWCLSGFQIWQLFNKAAEDTVSTSQLVAPPNARFLKSVSRRHPQALPHLPAAMESIQLKMHPCLSTPLHTLLLSPSLHLCPHLGHYNSPHGPSWSHSSSHA